MGIKTFQIGGLTVPFVVSDELYNMGQVQFNEPVTYESEYGEMEEWALQLIKDFIDSYVPNELKGVPYLFYNIDYKRKVNAKYSSTEILSMFFNSTYSDFYSGEGSNTLYIDGTEYPYGIILRELNNVTKPTHTEYYNFYTGRAGRFPSFDNTLGYITGDASTRWGFSMKVDIIPSSAIDYRAGAYELLINEKTCPTGIHRANLGFSLRDNRYPAVFRSFSISANYTASLSAISAYLNGEPSRNVMQDYIPPSKYDPYGGGGVSGPAGGNGSFSDGTSGDSSSTVPDGSAESNYAKTGLFTIYAMDLGQLQVLGSKLYADDLTERIGLEVMKFLWNSPIEAAISVQSYPFALPGGSSSSTGEQSIKFGSLVLEGVSGSPVSDSSMQIAWGSIQLREFWGNFLDYAPHTKIDLYLPWGAGFVALDPHDCLPGALSIVTNVELAKGTCVHVVTGKYGVIGCYGGKCSTEIPLSALDTGAKFLTTTVAVAAGVAGSVAAGAGVVAGTKAAGAAQATAMRAGAGVETAIRAGRAAERVASIPYQSMSRIATSVAVPSAVAAMRTPPSIQRSGSFYSSGAGLGPQKPFVIISRPEQNVPGGYGRQFGYPSNMYSGLSRGSGYTEVAAIHLSGINATGKELEEIEDLLKGGVIL